MLVNYQMFVLFHFFHFLILAVLGSSHFAGINLDEESLLNIYRKVIVAMTKHVLEGSFSHEIFLIRVTR